MSIVEIVVTTKISAEVTGLPEVVMYHRGGEVKTAPNRVHVTLFDGEIRSVRVEASPLIANGLVEGTRVWPDPAGGEDVEPPNWLVEIVTKILDRQESA